MAKKEENPYLHWLKMMPEKNREHFLNTAFQAYLSAWRFDDKTEKMIEKIIQKRMADYLETKKVKERIEKVAMYLLEKPAGEIKENIIWKLIREIKNLAADNDC